MGRTTGRSADETRRLVLAAAARVIPRHGISASLELIAESAGLSKGGVLYHFSSKDQLLLALAQEEFDAFRASVSAQLRLFAEDGPGRLVRAYIRASLLPRNLDEFRERFTLVTQLLSVPAVLELARIDEQEWNSELERDGVPEAVRVLVLAAADGFEGASIFTGEYTEPVRARLEADLLEMVDRSVVGSHAPTALA